MNLDVLRMKIDEIDNEIVRLFCERMRVCAEIAVFKQNNNLNVLDPEREKCKLIEVLGRSDEDLREYVGDLYSRIFELSRLYQKSGQRDGLTATLSNTVKPTHCPLRFGLLGEKLGHSFSPQIHARIADYEYKLYERQPGEIAEFLAQGDFDGLNVTVPYKKDVLSLCATLSEVAARIGSVNTLIKNDDGTLHGDNTDYFGFSYMLCRAGVDVKGKKAVILGSGGSAATVNAVLSDYGAGSIVTISRRGIDNYENSGRHSDAQILINTTPVGMFPDNGASPVDLGIFGSCEVVLDIISNPMKTRLMLQAEDMGIPCYGGLDMLVAQAMRSCELFLGVRQAGGGRLAKQVSRAVHKPACGNDQAEHEKRCPHWVAGLREDYYRSISRKAYSARVL